MINWNTSNDGMSCIHYIATDVISPLGDNSYIKNNDAKAKDADKIIQYLKLIIFAQWVD